MTVINTSEASIEGALRAGGFVGRVVQPADGDYDRARAGWNGAIDRRPAAVAYATDADRGALLASCAVCAALAALLAPARRRLIRWAG